MSKRRWVRSKQPSPRGSGFWIGLVFTILGVGVSLAIIIHPNPHAAPGELEWLLLSAITLAGLALVVRGLRKGNHAEWLRRNGEARSAEVIDAQRDWVELGSIPFFTLTLEVESSEGTYHASVRELMPPEHVALAVGSRVRVFVNPQDPADLCLDRVEA